MNQMNSLIIEGKVVDDAEWKEVPNGKVCNFTIATERFFKSVTGETVSEVSYFDCVASGNLAIFCNNIKLEKDKTVRCVGRLKQKVWTDETGKKCSKIYIICEHVEVR